MAAKLRILIANDTLMYREGLRAIINADDLEIVDEAIVMHSAILLARRADVDVVVMGVSWHYDSNAGIEAIEQIKRQTAGKWIVALCEDTALIPRIKAAGADVILPIRFTKEELLESIRSISVRQAGFRYDVFVSYSHQDKSWIDSWLLPKLEAAGVCVCVDFRDFDVGASIASEMERAVLQSRKMLLVLTPEYLASEWAEFENTLAQMLDPAARKRRMLPLMLRACELPPRIRRLNYIDFTNPDNQDMSIKRLIDAIKK